MSGMGGYMNGSDPAQGSLEPRTGVLQENPAQGWDQDPAQGSLEPRTGVLQEPRTGV